MAPLKAAACSKTKQKVCAVSLRAGGTGPAQDTAGDAPVPIMQRRQHGNNCGSNGEDDSGSCTDAAESN